MQGNFFTELGNATHVILEVVRNAALSEKMTQLAVLFSITLVITIMYKGYEILFGRSQSPTKEVMWDLAAKAMIITFALNIGGWLTLVINAMDGFHEWAGGSLSMYKQIDFIFNEVRNLADSIWAKASGFSIIVAAFSIAMIYTGFGIAVLPALVVINATAFTQTILVIAAPLMFYCLLYKSTKNVFTQWLALLISNTLLVLFMSLFFKVFAKQIYKFVNTYQSQYANADTDSFFIGISMIFSSVLLVAMVFVAKVFAEKVGSVALDSAMQSVFSRVSNPISSVAGKTLGNLFGHAQKGGSKMAEGAYSAMKSGASVTGANAMSLGKSILQRMRNEA
ncbi:type IV secretion system protein [Campylobacter sp. RM5063]|uniref:type IV secretion system protein n=1 Tax=Campylobacter sp. RM5063 TaxID=2735747 RepID=UPI0021523644|nr:type IV secretion system protein [Campylobacter lari]MCR6513016.1 type IV secretion system protein [Campylobacter lari]MCR8708814.1 type IV secretion system protein [Campylobacter sp. RM5063]